MTTLWKVLLGLALVVPMGAYVVGSLVASSSTPTAEQAAVVVPGTTRAPETVPGVRFEPRPSASAGAGGDDDADDGGDDGDDNGADDGAPGDDDVRVVTPEPQPVPPPPAGGDDDDDDGDDDDGDDDDDDGDDD